MHLVIKELFSYKLHWYVFQITLNQILHTYIVIHSFIWWKFLWTQSVKLDGGSSYDRNAQDTSTKQSRCERVAQTPTKPKLEKVQRKQSDWECDTDSKCQVWDKSSLREGMKWTSKVATVLVYYYMIINRTVKVCVSVRMSVYVPLATTVLDQLTWNLAWNGYSLAFGPW